MIDLSRTHQAATVTGVWLMLLTHPLIKIPIYYTRNDHLTLLHSSAIHFMDRAVDARDDQSPSDARSKNASHA